MRTLAEITLETITDAMDPKHDGSGKGAMLDQLGLDWDEAIEAAVTPDTDVPTDPASPVEVDPGSAFLAGLAVGVKWERERVAEVIGQ